MNDSALSPLIWSAMSLQTGLPLLLQILKRYPVLQQEIPPIDSPNPDLETMSEWLERVARQTRLEFKEVETAYPDIEQLLNNGGPALIRLPSTDSSQDADFVILVGSYKQQAILLSHTGSEVRVARQSLREMLATPFERPILEQVQHIARSLSSDNKAIDAITTTLLKEQLVNARIKGVWLLRHSPGENFFRQMWQVNLPKKIVHIVVVSLIYQGLSVLAWGVIGQASLTGAIESLQLQLWGLLLLTLIPVQLINLYIKNRLSLDAGILVRGRLLHSILQLEPDTLRQHGSAHFFSILMNIESLEVNALGIAFASIMAITQLIMGAFVLVAGTGGWLHAYLLLVWISLMLFMIVLYYRAILDWNHCQQQMTSDLIERMTGQRTRLVQEKVAHRHVEEDVILARYAAITYKMDRINSVLDVVISHRGWLLTSLTGLAYIFSQNHNTALMLMSIVGITFVSGALNMLKQSLRSLLEALISWQQVRDIYQADKQWQAANPNFISPAYLKARSVNTPIIEAQDISYVYPQSHKTILDNCSFSIEKGQKILLEGTSGSGKSTVASLLAGMRTPSSGAIRLYGLTQDSLGARSWHKRVVISPQFHENHVLSETFAFNLLMGRRWPPTEEDMQEAITICQELQLGKLLESMPAGMQQMVGESGWRLSHGEKSRLFIARTLLQGSDLIILDESFAALDPETLQLALSCVMRRSNALILIAHP